ncbi:serine/threonine-protein kinase [Nocardioides sp. BP30]|uniref:serine/threonine-protein kinase n=1 Tax=Nocardioides sp. BP30 TaxID=3036374 RepID=UPI002468D3CE|nr:serine/threonine-protein kinase [Nocardioides sp. BP30]WGL53214.1 serine/threonine-protein kinase [Nocardioides sp. BP30]
MSQPQIPGFTFVQHLGTGGFADVLLYEQEWPRQRVAVKVVRADLVLSEREKELFRSEADAMARLADHPYIVSVLTAGQTTDGRPYLVMRYCPPPDLGARVRVTPLSVAETLSTGVKLASAVETAHRSGILHRDIKPSNVLVTTYSEPALTDFGIAGLVHEVESEGEVRMSYPWAPPELIEGRSHGSIASDVYSLGATVWNLLVGRSPFAAPHGDNSDRALVARILHAPPPATQRPDVPPALDRLLQQCLAKDPSHRPQSALEVARSLQRIEAELGFGRTAVAVESGQTYAATPSDDATRVKPVSIAGSQSASQPGAVVPGAEAEPVGTGPSERGRGWLWPAAAVVVAAAVLVGLFIRGGGKGDQGGEPSLGPSASAAVTETVRPPTPVVTGDVAGGKVRFSWSVPGGAQDGDAFVWRESTTGREGRIERTDLALPHRGERCLQVTLLRGAGATAAQSAPSSPLCAG